MKLFPIGRFRPFDFFRDQDGCPSMSRLGVFLIVVVWGVLAIITKSIPDRTAQAAAFATGLYAANAARNAVQSMNQPKGDSPSSTT